MKFLVCVIRYYFLFLLTFAYVSFILSSNNQNEAYTNIALDSLNSPDSIFFNVKRNTFFSKMCKDLAKANNDQPIIATTEEFNDFKLMFSDDTPGLTLPESPEKILNYFSFIIRVSSDYAERVLINRSYEVFEGALSWVLQVLQKDATKAVMNLANNKNLNINSPIPWIFLHHEKLNKFMRNQYRVDFFDVDQIKEIPDINQDEWIKYSRSYHKHFVHLKNGYHRIFTRTNTIDSIELLFQTHKNSLSITVSYVNDSTFVTHRGKHSYEPIEVKIPAEIILRLKKKDFLLKNSLNLFWTNTDMNRLMCLFSDCIYLCQLYPEFTYKKIDAIKRRMVLSYDVYGDTFWFFCKNKSLYLFIQDDHGTLSTQEYISEQCIESLDGHVLNLKIKNAYCVYDMKRKIFLPLDERKLCMLDINDYVSLFVNRPFCAEKIINHRQYLENGGFMILPTITVLLKKK